MQRIDSHLGRSLRATFLDPASAVLFITCAYKYMSSHSSAFDSHLPFPLPRSQAVYLNITALSALEDLLEQIGLKLNGGERGPGSIVLACVLGVPSAYAISLVLLRMMSMISMPIIKVNKIGNT